ncbi:glycosyltransferase family 9 protein [Niveibacterium terrae]|uniref:glycosyltransferase family 9 protein n=1 Tax=Niveibacterium terrae TaxID=3373598 RepID=UPI003A8F31CF
MRIVDQFLGPCVVLLLRMCSIFRVRGNRKYAVDRVCLMKTSAIGDTVLVLSAVEALRKKYPNIRVDLVCGASNYEFARLSGAFDNLIRISATNPLSSILKLRKLRYDIVVDFASWARLDAIYSFFITADIRLGFWSRCQFRHYAYDKCARHSDLLHEIDNYAALCKIVGIDELLPPVLTWGGGGESIGFPSRYVVFHLWSGGSRSKQKSWPLENWIDLIRSTYSEFGIDVVLTGGPADKFRTYQLVAEIGNDIGSHVFNAAGISLSETLDVLSRAQCVVSVDTGVMHIAAALGVKVLSLHGPTHSDRWGGVSNRVVALNVFESIQQAPISLGYERCDDNIMSLLSTVSVKEKLFEMLKSESSHIEQYQVSQS